MMDTLFKAKGTSSLPLHLILDAQKFAFIIVRLGLLAFSRKRIKLSEVIKHEEYDIPNVENDWMNNGSIVLQCAFITNTLGSTDPTFSHYYCFLRLSKWSMDILS